MSASCAAQRAAACFLVKQVSDATMQSAHTCANTRTGSYLSRRGIALSNTFLNFVADDHMEADSKGPSKTDHTEGFHDEIVAAPVSTLRRSRSDPGLLSNAAMTSPLADRGSQSETLSHKVGKGNIDIQQIDKLPRAVEQELSQARRDGREDAACRASHCVNHKDGGEKAMTCPQQQATVQDGLTTLMFKNLPRSMSQKKLMQHLDESGLQDLYDFCYAPCCFKTGSSLRYAFINFKCASIASQVMGSWEQCRLPGMRVHHKGLEVVLAKKQGVLALVAHFGGGRAHRVSNPDFQPFIREMPPWNFAASDRKPLPPGLVAKQQPLEPGLVVHPAEH
mmetsp:Transcript_2328/g.4880  ORF Transcript_2328/g.4880 Transcript_2328/m.4880 type:complete len:336 (+) Transcript_2328:109-1116(+)